MNDLLHDMVFAWRNALRKPATSLLVVITLALGIGANSALFSMAYRVLLAPLPYADGARLVRLEQNEARIGRLDSAWSIPTFEDYRGSGTVFSEMFQYTHMPYTLLGAGDPYLAQSGVVSWNFFDALGIRSVAGRMFVESDDTIDAAPVMLVSYDFWESRLGADPAIVGKTLEVQDILRTVVGVLPRIFPYPDANDIWIPAASDPYRWPSNSDMATNRNNRWVSHVFGKLREDVTFIEAGREVEARAQRLAASYPDSYAQDYSVTLKPLKDAMVGDSARSFGLLLGLAFLVLLIAGANVGSLNLARLAARNQELAIREAVGANPSRITRQLLTESILFALAGGLSGLVIAYPGLRLLSEFASRYTPLASEVSMDTSVLWFSLSIAVLMGILSGSIAACGKRNINTALKEGGDKVTSSSTGVYGRKVLLCLQFSLSFVVLTTSALIAISLYRLNNEELGYSPDRVLAVSAVLNVDLTQSSEYFLQKFRDFNTRLLAETNAIPGVEAAGILGGSPLLQESVISSQPPVPFDIEGRSFDPDFRPNAIFSMASGNYFQVMDIRLLGGRLFADTDDEDAIPVAIINENFAERFFPGESALGKRIQVSGEQTWRTIVGVVGNVRSRNLDRLEAAAVYYSLLQWPPQMINLYVRSSADLNELGRAITDTVHRMDPQQPVQSVRQLHDIKTDWLAPTKLRATLISLFGLLALVVTLSGVIGAVSCSISRRVREIGIHMAIGASPTGIVNMFVAEGLKVYLGGLLLGLLLMLAASGLLEPLLYQTAALDAGIYLGTALVLTLTVLAALWLPARKAGLLNPMEALHAE